MRLYVKAETYTDFTLGIANNLTVTLIMTAFPKH